MKPFLRFRRGQAGFSPTGEAGFSLVEMLAAAVILGIGVLGLALLQTYTFAAKHGNDSLTTGVQVAQAVLDQAEMVGRNSIMCSQSSIAPPAVTTTWFGANPLTLYYNYSGQKVTANPYFTAKVTSVLTTGGANGVVTPVAKFGGIGLVTVTVTWTEALSAKNAAVTRNVTLNRRINYATS